MAEKIKVLIGDDSHEFGLALATLLKKEDMYAITRKKSGQILLGAMKREFVDIVILPAYMPDMSAADLLMEAQLKIGIIPAVIVIGDGIIPFPERELIDAGADCLIECPSSLEQIVKKVKYLYRFRSGNIKDRSGQEQINLEYIVTETIHKIGIPAHIKGYHYIRTGIILAINDSSVLESMTKVLYPTIAEQHDTTASRVERAIRHAIDIACERGNKEELAELFGNRRGKPTNSEFLAHLSDKLRLQHSFGRRL